MINKTIKYSLLSISILAFSACSSGRTIMINQDTVQPTERPATTVPNKRPEIKEEILLGNNSKNPNNGTLGNRVDVPLNNPMLGDMIYNEGEENIIEEPVVRSKNEVIERMPFPVGEYKYVKKKGRSTVSGTIYLENAHTSLKVKGQKIKLWLNPVTSYSRQWYHESYLGGYKLSKTDKRLYNYLKFTYSNSAGKFNFFGVPSGDYYLTGSISCAQECGFSQRKSIRLVREISVGSGVTTVDLMKHVP
ncbi:MAG: Unknown protein [uncultured Sulfurovum sp.]|uniref:Carboxypeptidase regulatory-like domain-containing protein n=1 Tax=uncultured Sulfurovum sp. TaxID=269237 RepID=A0A6S6U3S7_9BACT|nr:MAG: Unknown protein [uncultured Sulfurovum sp.]